MTKRMSDVAQRAVLIVLCVLLSQSSHYSQSVNDDGAQEVVKWRKTFEIKKPRQVLFNPVSKLLAAQREDGSVQIIDMSEGREQAVLPLADKGFYSMEWTRDGLRLLVVNSKSAALWDARTGTRLSASIDIPRDKYFQFFEDVTLSRDGKFLLNVDREEGWKATIFHRQKTVVQVWSLETGRLKTEIKMNGTGGRAELSPNGKQILLTMDDKDPRLWDVETGRLLAALKPPDPAIFREGSTAQFSPDGRFVIQTHETGTYIWHSSSAAIHTRIPFHLDSSDSILKGFSPDGKMFVTLQQTQGWHWWTSIEFHDCETGELRTTATAPKWEGWPDQMLWSEDGRTLVAASHGKKYEGRIWDVGTGKLKGTFPMVLTFSRIPMDWGFKDRDQLAMHPALPIISATNNKFIRFWNAETGELLQRVDNDGRFGHWSADGKLFVTVAKDLKSAQVWDVVPPEVQSRR